jgi:hypothetical protein
MIDRSIPVCFIGGVFGLKHKVGLVDGETLHKHECRQIFSRKKKFSYSY